jgi:Predicted DNA binding protein
MMVDGVRTELAVHDPDNCPVATLSTSGCGDISDISWAQAGPDGNIVEEFRAGKETTPSLPQSSFAIEPLVDVGNETVYRFDRDETTRCACDVVESAGSPVADVRVNSGTLYLTLHLENVEKLRDIVSRLDEVADQVELRYLVHANAKKGGKKQDRTLVDRGALTERQREVLRTAYNMGYFSYPRDANATMVAGELDIGLSTFTEHIAVAQRKLLSEILS